MLKVEHYVPNVKPPNLVPIQCIQLLTYYPHELWLLKILSNLPTQVRCLRVTSSWHHHTSMKICKACNENLVEDEYHLLLTYSTYKVIHKKYDNFLNGYYNKCHTQISTKKSEISLHSLHRESFSLTNIAL